MARHKFKDSVGREFEADVEYESGRGVDMVFVLESAAYLDDDSEVSKDEIEYVYNLPGDPVNTFGQEDRWS